MNKKSINSSKSSTNSKGELNIIVVFKSDSEEIINKIKDINHPDDYKKKRLKDMKNIQLII